jgi:DNA gyrase/topoisomerase IV subunit A
MPPMTTFEEALPDVRDGLTRKERVVLHVLRELQKERGDRYVPTAMLWGRVCEHFYIDPQALSAMLARLGARK